MSPTHDPTRWSHSTGEAQEHEARARSGDNVSDYSGVTEDANFGVAIDPQTAQQSISSGHNARKDRQARAQARAKKAQQEEGNKKQEEAKQSEAKQKSQGKKEVKGT